MGLSGQVMDADTTATVSIDDRSVAWGDSVYGPAWLSLPPLEEVWVAGEPLADSSVAATPGPVHQPASTELVTAGSLFRGLSVASGRGATLTGGLDLKLQGRIAEGIFLSGHLTDQNLPIQPEGNTRTLNELDQVRLALKAPWGSVEAGDFVLHSSGGSLSTFSRKLEGMQAQLRGGSWHGQAALAGTRGRFRHQSLTGQDGRQGPYHLTTGEGSRLLIVLAGTEKVWLNGRRLVRGDSQDYTIDYNTGELTFTPRHTIRSDSRIELDFEYSDLVYNRTTGFVSTGWEGRKSHLTITALRESDRLESNLEFSLSPADRERLRKQGDTPGGTWVSTALPDSAGNYGLVDGHYQWRGVGSGDYRVAFLNVGEAGEYRRLVVDNRIIYQWVPPGERSAYQTVYAPQRLLKPPVRHDYLGLDLRYDGSTTGRRAELEVGLSNTDLNRFSSLDDGDNLDMGYKAQLGWDTTPFSLGRRPLTLGARLNAVGTGRRFRAPGRFEAVEFQRDWDLDGPPGQYQWETVELYARAAAGAHAFAEAGLLAADTTASERLRWGVEQAGQGPATGRFQQTFLSRQAGDRYWNRSTGDLRYKYKWLQPTVGFQAEDRALNDTSGYRIEQLSAGLLAVFGQGTTLGLNREQRREVYRSGPTELARFWRLSWTRRPGPDTRLETSISLNDKLFSDNREDLSYFMGDFSLAHRPRNRPWWLDLRYRLDRSVAETKAVVYDSVAAGLGQYRYDPVYDNYVPDETGPFVRYVIPAGELQPVNSVQARLRSQVELNKINLPVDWFRGQREARLNLHGRLEWQARRHRLSTYYMPSLTDPATSRFLSTLRLDLALQAQRSAPRYTLRLSRQNRVSRDELAATQTSGQIGESRRQQTADLGLFSRIGSGNWPLNLEGHLEYGHDFQQSLVNTLRNHKIIRGRARGSLAATLSRKTTLTVNGRWMQEADRALGSLTVRTAVLGAGMQRKLGRQGRLRVDAERLRVTAPGDQALPYLLSEGFPRGWSANIRLSGQLHLSRNLLLSLSALSRQAPGRPNFISVNLELRSRF
ncbi:MAG: hypothetical protein IID13_05650 [Candidatus Marinimicrobia bacterium]|nr:hypothetical protein [Candidatus Neomarinimicrobiota bacterium]